MKKRSESGYSRWKDEQDKGDAMNRQRCKVGIGAFCYAQEERQDKGGEGVALKKKKPLTE